MALTHLLDTSVISRLGVAEVRDVVEPLTDAGQLGRAGITDLEVGYGSRNAREWDQDMGDLMIFPLVETTSSHVQRARQVQRMLAARSQRGPKVPDLLIAAAAEEARLIVVHYDADYDLIAQGHRPGVPMGRSSRQHRLIDLPPVAASGRPLFLLAGGGGTSTAEVSNGQRLGALATLHQALECDALLVV